MPSRVCWTGCRGPSLHDAALRGHGLNGYVIASRLAESLRAHARCCKHCPHDRRQRHSRQRGAPREQSTRRRGTQSVYHQRVGCFAAILVMRARRVFKGPMPVYVGGCMFASACHLGPSVGKPPSRTDLCGLSISGPPIKRHRAPSAAEKTPSASFVFVWKVAAASTVLC